MLTELFKYGVEFKSKRGVANGYAPLDSNALVPATYLPSYIDDVLEYANLAAFPVTGDTGKIYVALDTNKCYRWSGSTYVHITSGVVDSVGFRNKIINGDFQIWQGGTSFTNPTSNATAYCADQCLFWRAGFANNITATQQQTQIASKGVRVQRTAGDTSTAQISFGTAHESIDVMQLASKNLTFSFKAKCGANFSGASSQAYIQVWCGTGVDGNIINTFTGQAAIISQTITLTTSLQQFSATASLPANATQLSCTLVYIPTSTAGANDWFEITDIQLEEGAVATPIERRPYALELALCQRYYEISAPGSTFYGCLLGSTDSYRSWTIPFKVEKRIAPTMSVSGGNASWSPLATTTFAYGTCSAGNSTSNLYFTQFIANARI